MRPNFKNIDIANDAFNVKHNPLPKGEVWKNAELIDNNGFKTVKEGMDAAMEKKADVVVLCSSDDEYAALIPEAVKELDGRAELVLAGPETDEFKAMGITNFINVRTNVLATLKAFNAKLLK